MSINICNISGNIGADSELRMTPSGLSIVRFSVAVNERKRQQDGSYADYTNWINCVMFGKRAEALQPYLCKGSKVSLSGHLHQTTYEHNEERRSKIELIVDEVELMNNRKDN